MCGIAGLFNVNISLNLIQTMVDSISHRGPDNQSIWIDMQRLISFGQSSMDKTPYTRSYRELFEPNLLQIRVDN